MRIKLIIRNSQTQQLQSQVISFTEKKRKETKLMIETMNQVF